MAPPTQLRRSIGLGLITLYGLGNILGAGIYVLVGEVAGEAGMLAPLAFVLAALVAGISALSYGQLAARFPVSGGEAVYVHEAFRIRALAIVVGLILVTAGTVSVATLTRGVVGYAQELIDVPSWLIITVIATSLGLLAAWGIEQSVRVAATLTLIEAGGLILLIVAGSGSLASLPDHASEMLVPTSWDAILGVVSGALLAFFAFIGFEDMVNVAEEVEEPERNLPLGIILALLVSTGLYFLVLSVALLAASPERLASSDAPLAEVFAAAGGPPWVLGLIGVLAVLNGVLIQLIMVTRIIYGMANKGWLPEVMAAVHPRTQTPIRATVVVVVLVVTLALWLPLAELAGTTSALILVVFALVNAALVRLRLREDEGRLRGLVAPSLGAVASAGLLLAQLLAW